MTEPSSRESGILLFAIGLAVGGAKVRKCGNCKGVLK